MFNKFKPYLDDDSIFYTLVILLIAVASFGLGKLSVGSVPIAQEIMPISYTQTASVPVVVESEVAEKQFVGSKNGSKYHLLTCPGASQINGENKVFFSSEEDARSKGYTPASNCAGLAQ